MTAGAELQTVDTPLGGLHEWPRNPRRISKPRLEQLKRALEAEPEMLRARPLIALPDGTVVAGNQRLRAARELGWASLPVVVVDLDDERAAEWALRDNRGYGEDDEALVGALLAELAASGRDLDLSGYDSGEVDRLLAAVRPAPVVDPDDAPPLPAEPKSERGVVYELGPHRVMCGDATKRDDVTRFIGAERACLLLTDPPYGVLFGSAKKNAIHGDLSQAAIPVGLALALEVALDDDARLYVFGGSGNWSMYAKLFDYHLQQEPHPIVWVKDSFVMRPNGYHSQFEMLYFGWKGRGGSPEHWHGDRKSSDVWQMTRDRDGMHSTQKPVEACALAVQNSAPINGLVFDPFAGSGTTLIACEQLGRRALCMEIDPGYVDVIRQRYADFTGQPELAP